MNPFHVVLITIGYLLSVFLGRLIMKLLPRFELRTFSILHNLFLILLSLYMGVEITRQAVINNFGLFGNGVDTSAKGVGLANVLWVFFVSKIPEFVDTWIMVMKKNDRQISFLHLYHHSTIFMIWWAIVYYAPGGDSYLSAAMNSFVHVLMYSYYFLNAIGVKDVPWKKYITQIQMFQFLVNLIHGLYDSIVDIPGYPKWSAQLIVVYMVTLLFLFGNFYVKNMSARRSQKVATKKD